MVWGKTVAVVVGSARAATRLHTRTEGMCAHLEEGSLVLVPSASGNALVDDSFVFTPIVACRIFDSRFGAGGALTNGETRAALLWGGNFAAQGGIDCGLTSRIRAVHVNVTAVSVTGVAQPGWVTVYPYGAPRPNASVLNFTVGQIVPNAFTVPTCVFCDSELNLFNAIGTTHLIIDVLGYSEPPLAAEVNLDGTISSAPDGITASRLANGQYQVNFPRNVTDCIRVASLGSGLGNAPIGFISTADRFGAPNAVFVLTANTAGTTTDLPFSIALTC